MLHVYAKFEYSHTHTLFELCMYGEDVAYYTLIDLQDYYVHMYVCFEGHGNRKHRDSGR